MDLIQQVKDKQKKDGTSTRCLSKFVGITFSALAKVLRGEHAPSWNTRRKLEEFTSMRFAIGAGESYGPGTPTGVATVTSIDRRRKIVTVKSSPSKEMTMAKATKKGSKKPAPKKTPKKKRAKRAPLKAAATKRASTKRKKPKAAKRKARMKS